MNKIPDIIKRRNRKLALTIVLITLVVFSVLFSLYVYFFVSKLDVAKKKEVPVYFSVLFVDNDIPYSAYIGVVSSFHSRIGFIGISRNMVLWDTRKKAITLEEHYKLGKSKQVFEAIENTVDEKITYKVVLDNNAIRNVIDLIGGVRMYVEKPIYYEDKEKNYYLNFETGEYLFTSEKVIAYLHYLTMEGYSDRETLFKVEDILVNTLISFIQLPDLRERIKTRALRNMIARKIESNLRPPDVRAFSEIFSKSTKQSFVVEAMDGELVDGVKLVPILEGRAVVRQLNDITLYTFLQTERSKISFENVKLSVLNGTAEKGLADRINIRMRYRGFSAGEYGNFGATIDESVVLIRTGQIEKAFMVAKEAKIGRVYASTDRRVLNDAIMALGSDYYEITR